MKPTNLLLLLLLCFIACKNKQQEIRPEKFDRVKWMETNGLEHPYRERMLQDLIDNYTLKGLNAKEVFNLLGEPDRTDDGHLFYTVVKKYFANVYPIYTRTLVIKLRSDSTVEWRKIHG
ncbi:hypothetical protein EXU57_09295 [Segetibacter sp. 3557_3]|uniref:hypothetical protein n=1 Tax=Segetibacter sp. 3557_3 TaxID=2547429 RepID=UPI001058CE78|nr:hypothetical protein [Segetibacter sp. 3557_3]TDH26988.1 hypothetical protein EXU57_09295 [Segetibacter sp. 3557_3]